MKRGTVVTEYKCVCCSTKYDTRKQAAACSRYKFPALKQGDVILWNNRPWLVKYDIDSTGFFTVERVPVFYDASGFGWRNQKRMAISTAYFCNKNPVSKPTVKEAVGYLQNRKKQFYAAERWLRMVQQSNGETDDKPGINAKKTRLARRDDRPAKRVPKKSVRKPS